MFGIALGLTAVAIIVAIVWWHYRCLAIERRFENALRNVNENLPTLTESLGLTINYVPRGDRVIVRRLPPPTAKQGEVLIPGSQRKELNEGIVVAVGPHRDLADLKPGQHICFLDFAGTPVEVDGQEYLSLRETEIHGVRR